jgi:hypothetical protein
VPATLESFLDLGRTLERVFPGYPPWWVEQAERFYSSGARRFVARVGRGGVKSTMGVGFALNEVLFGDWQVPPGEVHYFAFVSASKPEAAQRLRQLEARLDALRIPHDRSGDEIVLRDMARGFRVFAATIGAVSGFRCFGFVADELAKWMSADHSANPAVEVIASVRAMCVTHPGAREFLMSSPFGRSDLHYELVEEGSNAEQVVAIAPTWIANPRVTEEQTRKLEPNERVWRREYAAEPGDTESAAWPSEAIERITRDFELTNYTASVAFGLSDPSSARHDGWIDCVARWWMPTEMAAEPPWLAKRMNRCINGEHIFWWEPLLDAKGQRQPNPHYKPVPPLLVIEDMIGTSGAFWSTLSAAEHIARRAQWYRGRVKTIIADDREGYALGSLYAMHKLHYMPLHWDNANKVAAVERVSRWLADSALVVSRDVPAAERVALVREMKGFKEKLLPSGYVSFAGRTDDRVACLLTCAMADAAHLLPGSPIGPRPLDALALMQRRWDVEALAQRMGTRLDVDEYGRLISYAPANPR